jgi:hypothetical protein
MASYNFEATLKRPEGVGTWTYLDIPVDVSASFGVKGQVKVKGIVNGQPFRSSALPHGDGSHYLVVGKSIRDAAGATQGDCVRVTLELDFEEREVSIPGDLLQALMANPGAKLAFDTLSYSHKKQYIDWIEVAKKEDTRQSRITKTIEKLPQGWTPKG